MMEPDSLAGALKGMKRFGTGLWVVEEGGRYYRISQSNLRYDSGRGQSQVGRIYERGCFCRSSINERLQFQSGLRYGINFRLQLQSGLRHGINVRDSYSRGGGTERPEVTITYDSIRWHTRTEKTMT